MPSPFLTRSSARSAMVGFDHFILFRSTSTSGMQSMDDMHATQAGMAAAMSSENIHAILQWACACAALS